MVESVLAITNLLLVVAVLVYFYFREIKHQNSIDNQLEKTQKFYEQISLSKDALAESSSESEKKLLNQIFGSFLKHIKELEQMVLPKPITRNMVEDIMLRTPPLVENEIEKNPEDITEENFMDVFSRIPIDDNTKVSFENEIDQLPAEEIIEEREES